MKEYQRLALSRIMNYYWIVYSHTIECLLITGNNMYQPPYCMWDVIVKLSREDLEFPGREGIYNKIHFLCYSGAGQLLMCYC